MDPITLALIAGLAATGTGLSMASAGANNRAMAASSRSAAGAARVQYRQVDRAAALERQKRIHEARRIEGLILTKRAESGTGTGGSAESLLVQNDFDAALDNQITRENRANEFQRVRSGLVADLDNLRSHIVNPIVAAISGGIEGVGTGLNIVDGVNRAFPRKGA